MLSYLSSVLDNSIYCWSVVAGLLILYLLVRNRNLPPGPWGFPILGYSPFLTSEPHIKLNQLAEKYGDVMSLTVMGQTVIHLNTFDAIKEAFKDNGENFSARPQGFSMFRWFFNGLGITQSEGPIWTQHRRFALHTLRDFGLGKLSMERRIQDIADDLLVVLEQLKGQPRDLFEDLANCATNVLCSIVFDKQYSHTDPEFLAIRSEAHVFFRFMEGRIIFLDPFLKFLPNAMLVALFPRVAQSRDKLRTIADNFIQEHLESLDPDNPRDYMDVFLNERRIAQFENKSDKTFTLDRLNAISLNLLLAGTETTATQLHWAIKILSKFKDVQQRIQEELDRVVGRERKASVLDKLNLPYTEATILEIMRFSSMISTIPIHSNSEKCQFRGFTIPKRSFIFANAWSVNFDKAYYNKPEQFDPLRFLDKDGKVVKTNHIVSFSIGKRSCPAEALGKMEIFLILTSILQKFTVSQVGNDQTNFFESRSAIVRKLLPYKISVKIR